MLWNAGTPAEGMCYRKHTLPGVPDLLHMPSVVTHITPFRKGHLAIYRHWLYPPPTKYRVCVCVCVCVCS